MYDTVKRNGGDGFYGGLSIPYEEPVMLKYNYIKDECPNAEMVQPKMMQFKCNYRDLNKAKKSHKLGKISSDELFDWQYRVHELEEEIKRLNDNIEEDIDI